MPSHMNVVQRYAQLLVEYCLEIKAGEKLYIYSTTLGEPLVREVYRFANRLGAKVVTDLSWREQSRIFYQEAKEAQLTWANPLIEQVYQTFDAYLYIRAPFNLREEQSVDGKKRAIRNSALKPLHNIYNQRTADRSLKRCLCQYPTQAAAQEAGMSLEEYERFIFESCRLFEADPAASWLQVRNEQQQLVDYLNGTNQMEYKNAQTDLSFSVEGRTWINSDGRTNMPSGEVFSAPVEDSVNGYIHFDYPSVFRGHPVQGITLWVENGVITRWKAEIGQELLDEIFQIEGARQFGEVAIGTNYKIQQATKNILFDEKIGGTIHMAVGQSYKQTGGLNNSSIHWDMISEMKKGGQIFADGVKIYEDGVFMI